MRYLSVTTSVAFGVLVTTSAASAFNTFGLDDNPTLPAMSPPSLGFGAENPFAFPAPGYPPGYAPSPALPAIPCIESDLLVAGPGVPALHAVTPNGHYDASLSDNAETFNLYPQNMVKLRFSVDRLTFGLAGTAVRNEAMSFEQPGDLFWTTRQFNHPVNYVGWGGPVPYGGVLPAAGPGANSNALLIDEGAFGLTAPPNPPGHATHDNMDQFDRQPFDMNGDNLVDVWTYFTVYPGEAAMFPPAIVSAAHIYDRAPFPAPNVWPRNPYAFGPQMGLIDTIENGDAIDALVVFDRGAPGGSEYGGPGAEPGLDFALFSLAPGSVSLAAFNLSASDVFFTDFTGKFFTYAPAMTLGLTPNPGGEVGEFDNLDALEIAPFCPADIDGSDDVAFADLLVLLGAWGGGGPADLNGDGIVGFADLLILLGNWGYCP